MIDENSKTYTGIMEEFGPNIILTELVSWQLYFKKSSNRATRLEKAIVKTLGKSALNFAQ